MQLVNEADSTRASVALAHSANHSGQEHLLSNHLKAVANMARDFSAAFGGQQVAHDLGLWHDLGKWVPEFQEYLRGEQVTSGKRRGPDHKRVGALLAAKRLGPAALAIQGHHGGLHTPAEFKEWLLAEPEAQTARMAGNALAALGFPAPEHRPDLPEQLIQDPTSVELLVRFLLSCLVDADFLDTESHFQPAHSRIRSVPSRLEMLWERFEKSQQGFPSSHESPLLSARKEIYEGCLVAAQHPPGLFRLTVPTGGGKTRSAMGFALKHALAHGLDRVIIAVPFLTITEQTADVYRGIFEPEGEEKVVLEHYTGISTDHSEDSQSEPDLWSRLAAENWDSPVVVTTTVQLFESLFGSRPTKVRKLHNLGRAVLILDEIQALPLHLLRPCLDVLRELCLHYGTTVVLSTATQPSFDSIPELANLDAREIIVRPERYFDVLKRVEYEWRVDAKLSWNQVAALAETADQALAVVNTKADAIALLRTLSDPEALHLSTLLCGAHRREVLRDIRGRLCEGRRCRVVSTQVVEAGVDLDFPLVLRALGPLDAIIQAAGRCNREGRLDAGRVIIFDPEDGGMPPGAYRAGAGITKALVASGATDLHNPAAASAYFQQLLQLVDLDRDRIQALRRHLDYPEVAKRLRLIEQDSEPVVVTSWGSRDERSRVRRAVEELRRGSPRTRLLLRDLQPYTVNLPLRTSAVYRDRGLIVPVLPGVGEWLGGYDQKGGLQAENTDPFIL